VPNGTVLADYKDLKPAILICPDRQAVCFPKLRWRASQTVPKAPIRLFINLPGMPERAIISEGVNF
jgi:hypothetical protein